jgi:hypothetical protein
MALYKRGHLLTMMDHPAFDAIHPPGATAIDAGVYRCIVCDDEIGIAKGHTLPPQNHHQHLPMQGPVRWQLLVAAVQKK